MANIITTRATNDWSSNREELDFAEGIALLNPNENPLTLMTMKFKKKTSGNIKHSWLYDELVPETDTADTTTACVTAGVTLFVDNPTYFAPGDVVRVNRSNETVLVTAVSTAASSLTITRDYGKTGGAYTALATSFADEDYLTIIGNAFMQGHELPQSKSTLEIQMDNYCQEQRTPFELTEVAQKSKVRGAADWPWQMKKGGITHQRKQEFQHFWGHPDPGTGTISASGTGNATPAVAGGLWHYLVGGTSIAGTGSDRLVSQAEITQTEFLDFLEPAFEYGSQEKVMFCSPVLRSALDYWGISKLQTFSEKTLYGMNVAKWVSSHGTIVFITHKMLKDPGDDGAYNFLVDMDDVSIVYFTGGSTEIRELDPYKASGKTIRQAEYMTTSCLEVRVPKKHACLYGVKTYAA